MAVLSGEAFSSGNTSNALWLWSHSVPCVPLERLALQTESPLILTGSQFPQLGSQVSQCCSTPSSEKRGLIPLSLGPNWPVTWVTTSSSLCGY